jgi:transcriptional regulator with XRE-family HTH domain
MPNRITLQCLKRQHNCVLPLQYAVRTIDAMDTLGKRLKKAREYAKLTQAALAEKAGVAQSAVSRIEREEADTSGYVVLFAKICGVSPDWLALEDGEMLNYALDSKIQTVLHAMENLPEYKKDILVQTSIALAEQSQPKNNGTK